MIKEELLSTQINLGDLLTITIQDSDYYIFYDYSIGEKLPERCTYRITQDEFESLNNIISKEGKKFDLSVENIGNNKFKFRYLSSKFKGQRDYGDISPKELAENRAESKKEYGYQILQIC